MADGSDETAYLTSLTEKHQKGLSSYMLWLCEEGREKAKQQYPDVTPTQIMSICGRMWRETPDDIKAIWKSRSDHLKAYVKEHYPQPEKKKRKKKKKKKSEESEAESDGEGGDEDDSPPTKKKRGRGKTAKKKKAAPSLHEEFIVHEFNILIEDGAFESMEYNVDRYPTIQVAMQKAFERAEDIYWAGVEANEDMRYSEKEGRVLDVDEMPSLEMAESYSLEANGVQYKIDVQKIGDGVEHLANGSISN